MNQKIISILAAGLVLLIAIGFYVSSSPMMSDSSLSAGDESSMIEHADNLQEYEISPSEVVQKVQSNEDVILLDVRSLAEYEEIHLENARLLPVEELSQQSLTDIGLGLNMKDAEIIIYCRGGARSQVAYNLMQSLGYTNLTVVAGGMIHWEEDGYPLTETGPYTGSLSLSGASDTAETVAGPKITIDRTLHDFGEIAQYGGTVATDFTVTNDGTEALTIGDITTSCSCTTASVPDSTIEPGDSQVLTVVFDPNLHAEPLDVFTRTVFIPTNDPATPETEVVVRVDILEGV